jgi:hypothetical protein
MSNPSSAQIQAGSTKSATEEVAKLRAEACLKDLEITAQMITNLQNSQKQILGYALIAAGVVIPILVGTTGVSSPDKSAIVLLTLPMLYWGMAVAYFSYGKHTTTAGKYTELLSRELNSTISSPISLEHQPIFQWESFLRLEWQRSLDSKILMALWPVGEILIIALPGLGSLLGFLYIVRSENLPWQDYYTYLIIFDVALIVVALVMGIMAATDLISHRRPE